MEMIPSMPLEMETSRCSVMTCSICRAVEDAVVEEDEVEGDAADEVVTDIMDQAGGAVENVAD
ncbi:unnamed protein product [Prunus armeniaca]